MFDATCTVTGPTVIDIHGQVSSVPDRCGYGLIWTPSAPDFHVLANFQERRRKDVSFLDSVTLQLDVPGVHIHLGQGGRVWVSYLQPQSCVSVEFDPTSSLHPPHILHISDIRGSYFNIGENSLFVCVCDV